MQPTDCRGILHARLLDRSCKRLRICIAWVLFMEVCSARSFCFLHAESVCVRSTSGEHRACRRKCLEDVGRGCASIHGLARDRRGSWVCDRQAYTAISRASFDVTSVCWTVKQLQCQAIAMSRLLTSVLLSFLARRHQECDVRYRSELQKL